MKRLLLLTTLLLGCTKQENRQSDEKTQILLQKSDSAIQSIDKCGKELDSVSTKVIEQTTKTLDSLHLTVNNYQNELLKVKSVRQTVIYRTDTVFVEKKKNFWGKEKTKINTVSDSSITEIDVSDSSD